MPFTVRTFFFTVRKFLHNCSKDSTLLFDRFDLTVQKLGRTLLYKGFDLCVRRFWPYCSKVSTLVFEGFDLKIRRSIFQFRPSYPSRFWRRRSKLILSSFSTVKLWQTPSLPIMATIDDGANTNEEEENRQRSLILKTLRALLTLSFSLPHTHSLTHTLAYTSTSTHTLSLTYTHKHTH